jgi:hypothetical protein
MRYSDRPITHPRQDLLGRAEFALTLARAIDGLSIAKDGFVIGIVGEWGSGKTSVIELVRRYLRHIEMMRASEQALLGDTEAVPRTLEDLEQMADVYEKIESHIVSIDESNKDVRKWVPAYRQSEFRYWLGSDSDAEIANRYWQLKLRAEQNARTIVVVFSPWLVAGRTELASALLSELARALGDRLGDEVRHAFGELLTRLAEFAPVAGAGLDLATHGVGGALLLAGGSLSGRIAKKMTSGPTLDASRKRLRRLLRNLGDQKILVIIDDLDRLTPLEAVEMVALVKNLGDLPNVVYLLSYDEPNLSNLIHKALEVDGRDFLEKIVQYPVHLPRTEDDDLAGMLGSDLQGVLGDLSDGDRGRLSAAWGFVLKSYLRNPRDVRRFINAIVVARPGLGDYTDQIDLLVLEALRLFEPDVYYFIRRHIDDLVG